MATLTENVPPFEVLVRAEFLYDLDESYAGQFEAGMCHALSAIKGRALGFHVLLDNGAHIGRLPIHALVQHEDAARVPVDKVWMRQLWDCFSYDLAVTEYHWLSEMRCRVALPDKTVMGGQYCFTVDYYNDATAEAAGDSGWKCHLIIALDDGTFTAQPNNRVCWYEPSRVVPFDAPPRYKTMSRTWKVEHGAKWRTSDDDLMFYDVQS